MLSTLLNSIQHLGVATETAGFTIKRENTEKRGFPRVFIGVNAFVILVELMPKHKDGAQSGPASY